MTFKKGKLLSTEKNKKLYLTSNPDYICVHFTDNLNIPIKSKKTILHNKGSVNNAIASALFQFLESYHVDTYFEELYKPNEMIVRCVDVLPLEVFVWNYGFGSLQKRFSLNKNQPLPCPVVEYYHVDEKQHSYMINQDHACAFELATLDEMQLIDRQTRKINAVLKSFFDRRNLSLVHFQLSFGRFEDKVILAGDISLDNCVFLDRSDESAKKSSILPLSCNEEEFLALKDRICL
ncbi:hypothetical protein BVY01_02680 [bacterium I07]|nr:hypothetical protein BVY01_02680 [bacterium I07]